MWRNQQSAALLPNHNNIYSYFAILALLAVDRLAIQQGVEGKIQYTEGGSFNPSASASNIEAGEYDIVDLINSNARRGSSSSSSPYANEVEAEQEEEEEENERLAGIVNELQRIRSSSSLQQEQADTESEEPIEIATMPKSTPSINNELEQLNQFGAKIRKLAESNSKLNSAVPPTATKEETVEVDEQEPIAHKPLTAQKKGQSEFVEFVEPVRVNIPSKQLKNRETLEKRVADYRLSRLHREEESGVGLLYSSGNMLFIAFVTMCCVLSVVGVVGGAYYYKHVRNINADPFDDFTRYSPSGPGRDKLKKNFACEKGDETLAYKAQLHHYQQTKQKIIGDGLAGGRVAGIGGGLDVDDTLDDSDNEADLEHNFSVYECPGLASTGDIEVTNPNFVDSAASSPTREQ